jgi:hypothetical protein
VNNCIKPSSPKLQSYAAALVSEMFDVSKACWALGDDKGGACYFRNEHGCPPRISQARRVR